MKILRTKSISFPFSVADIESGPVIKWDSFTLIVEFTDYLQVNCQIQFENVSHFEFLDGGVFDSNSFEEDGVVEVIDSSLVDKLGELGEIPEKRDSKLRHIVVGFNTIGSYLLVVCEEVKPIVLD